jgi:hypothetical protein
MPMPTRTCACAAAGAATAAKTVNIRTRFKFIANSPFCLDLSLPKLATDKSPDEKQLQCQRANLRVFPRWASRNIGLG